MYVVTTPRIDSLASPLSILRIIFVNHIVILDMINYSTQIRVVGWLYPEHVLAYYSVFGFETRIFAVCTKGGHG